MLNHIILSLRAIRYMLKTFIGPIDRAITCRVRTVGLASLLTGIQGLNVFVKKDTLDRAAKVRLVLEYCLIYKFCCDAVSMNV